MPVRGLAFQNAYRTHADEEFGTRCLQNKSFEVFNGRMQAKCKDLFPVMYAFCPSVRESCQVSNTVFLGILGITEAIFMDDNGDRDTSYAVMDMDPATGIFRVRPSSNTRSFAHLDLG